jgi:hypothetical protein
MEYRRVGRSGLKVSALAFGTSSYPFDSVAGEEFVVAGLDAGSIFSTRQTSIAPARPNKFWATRCMFRRSLEVINIRNSV